MYNFSEIAEENFRPFVRDFFNMFFSSLIEEQNFYKLDLPIKIDVIIYGYQDIPEKRKNIMMLEARCVFAKILNKYDFVVSPDDIEINIMEIKP